jgi:hypothetical protein
MIGSGKMGVVYEVTHLTTGHRHALNTLQADPTSHSGLIEQLLNE